MELKDLELLQFMPAFMREDSTTKGFAYAIENQLSKVVTAIESIQIHSNIENLNGNILDELAWQFNIPEYQPDLDITAKRAILKGCLKTHKNRGTPAAIEKVIGDILGDGVIQEWFEYGGDPYHFRVVTSNPSVNTDQANLFLKVIENVKRGSTVMDAVIVELAAQMSAFYASALQTGDNYTVEMVV